MRLHWSRVLAAAPILAAPTLLSAQQPPPDPSMPVTIKAPSTLEAAPKPTGYESDLYCFGYLGSVADPFVAEVTSAQDVAEQVDFASNDLLYLDGGADRGLRVGDEYWLVTPESEVFSPVDGASLGRFYQYRGRGTVLSIGAHSAIFRVTESCTDIPIGAFLKKFEPIPIPLARKTPPAQPGDLPSGKPQGRIVYSRDGVIALGQDMPVIIDLGIANGIQPGGGGTLTQYVPCGWIP